MLRSFFGALKNLENPQSSHIFYHSGSDKIYPQKSVNSNSQLIHLLHVNV